MTARVSREDLRQQVVTIAEAFGLDLYDIEHPSLESTTLRVFISRQKNKSVEESTVVEAIQNETKSRDGVTLEECAKVSRQIMNWLEEQQVSGHEDWAIEVSSPGVNRKLKTPEHFQNAVGERIKLTFRDAESGAKKTLTVKLEKADEDKLTLVPAAKSGKKQKRSPSAGKAAVDQQSFSVEYSDVDNAQIDFDFI